MQVEKNGNKNEASPAVGQTTTKNQTTVERKSDRELVITRTFNGPAEIVFDCWTNPELLMRWWAPRSFDVKLVSCEIDLRVGGKYRYEFAVGGGKTFVAFGIYKEVERPTRLVWTNSDADEAVTTATFTEKAGKTTLTLLELHPSKEALDEARASKVEEGTLETFDQLDDLLATPPAA